MERLFKSKKMVDSKKMVEEKLLRQDLKHFFSIFGESQSRRFATEVLNGQTISYERIGRGPDILMLLPGGLGSSRTDFSTILHRFDPEQFTLIAWDPPGYGKSRPPDRTWPARYYDRDADVAINLMEQLQCVPFTCVGWSDGGNTSMIMAANRPDLVKRLVIWGANAFITEEDRTSMGGIRFPEQWSPRMRAPFEEDLGTDYFHKLLGEWVNAYNTYPDGEICRTRLNEIQCPTLILHGEKDTIVPRFQPDLLEKEIKNAKRINYPDGKHNLHMKYAEQFVRDVTAFCKAAV